MMAYAHKEEDPARSTKTSSHGGGKQADAAALPKKPDRPHTLEQVSQMWMMVPEACSPKSLCAQRLGRGRLGGVSTERVAPMCCVEYARASGWSLKLSST